MLRIHAALAVLAVPAVLLVATSAATQVAGAAAPSIPFVPIGSPAEERERAGHLVGEPGARGFLLRSAGSRVAAPPGRFLRPLPPSLLTVWNSEIPHSLNDGAMWAGRGLSASLLVGFEAASGPIRLVLAPNLVVQQDRDFDSLTLMALSDVDRSSRIPPWFIGEHAADLPYRLGDGSAAALHPGESSLTVRAGALAAGIGTESHWWGPGVRNAILLGNNAGGFPHAMLRTARPIRTRVGVLEARWVAGALTASAYDTAVGGRRSLSAAGAVLDVGGGLALGTARVVYGRSGGGDLLLDAPGALIRWRGAGDTTRSRPFEQMISFFGRWVAPEEGVELYAEWARQRLPTSLRDLLEQPEHTQGYTVGGAWIGGAGAGSVRLGAEATYLERSATFRARPTPSWYAGRAVPQGYTHRGQSLGAAIGPGASAQWFGGEYRTARWDLGAGITRIRWADDAYWDRPGGHNLYRAHDVNLLASVTSGVALGALRVDGGWTFGRRYNYLFQNPAGTWAERDQGISPFNHTLRLRISATPPPLLLGR